MNVVRKIEITEDQAKWLDEKVACGSAKDVNSIFQQLISERQFQEKEENPEYMLWLNNELKLGLESGISERTVDQIRKSAREKVIQTYG